MSGNFDGISAEPQPNKNTADIDNRKVKENIWNEEQILEKEERKKNKSCADCPLTDNQKSIQTEDSEWNLMGNNKKKNIQRPLMEDLCIGNLTNNTREEEILAPLGLNYTTYLRKNSLVRKQYTDNGRFAGCIHVRMPQQFIETVLEINGLSFKNLGNLLLSRLQKWWRCNWEVRGIILHIIEVSPLGLGKVGRGEKMNIGEKGGQASAHQKNRQQQPRPNGQIPPRQGNHKPGPSNLTESVSGEQVWVDNVKAFAREKTLSGGVLLRWCSAYA